MSFKEGTQSTEQSEVPTTTPVLGDGPNKIAFSLREPTKLIQRGLAEEPRPENVKVLSLLVGVHPLLVNDLALPYNNLKDAIIYNLRQSF